MGADGSTAVGAFPFAGSFSVQNLKNRIRG